MSHPRTAVVLPAAGSGARVGAEVNKVLLPLAGVPVLAWSLRTLLSLAYVDHVVVVAREADLEAVGHVVEAHLPPDREVLLVTGGPTRHDSEARGFAPLREKVADGKVEVVVVHDAARPLADAALFDRVVDAALAHGGAVPVRPQPGLLHRESGRHVAGLVGVQTPQAFRAGPLLEAYARAASDGFTGTDTSSCFAAYAGLPVVGVPAPATNLKVTFPEDLPVAARLLPARAVGG